MKINIYYGGRGLVEDSTIYVISKMTDVLQELRVEVTRYNLYEQKNNITMMPNTLKDVDAVILATNVEWLGIGGFMQQFLDACWLYADKDKIKKIYMFPLVISNTYGERDAEQMLIKAWEILGGTACDGISAYVEHASDFETNTEYAKIIERKAENLYRMVNQKGVMLPSSINTISSNIQSNTSIQLTPQESEQLSMYVSDDEYVKKQKEDIEELTQLFKGMLEHKKEDTNQLYLKNFKDNFVNQEKEFLASYAITISDLNKTLIIEVAGDHLKCYYGEKEDAEVKAKTTKNVMNKIVNGKTTFQGAFMSGELTAKGNFKTLRTFDQVFHFNILS